MIKPIWAGVCFAASLLTLMWLGKQETPRPASAPVVAPAPIIKPVAPPVQSYTITNAFPGYQNYRGVVDQLKEWNKEAPQITEVGTYGKSNLGNSLYYIRITGKNDTVNPKVMITACIHGNEPLSTSTTMGYIGTLLSKYGKDNDITKLVDSRDIYFIPVVSPDSYPSARWVDGVDPNRDFPGPHQPNRQSTTQVAALQKFFTKHKFKAVISGHTFGRIYLYPHGDKNQASPDDEKYKEIVGEMARLSNYRMQRMCQLYSRPIFGTEGDWYYRNGAFAIIMEFGTHQRIPTMNDTKTEFDRTWKAVLHFIKEAPVAKLKGS